jgi:hypothetical protein
MAVKAAFVLMAPDADPKRHRASIKMPKFELTVVVAELGNLDQAVDVCRELVQNEGIQAITLCPGFSHQAVAKMANAVGEGVAINVARGDVPSGRITGEILKKEGWSSKGR